MKDEKVKINNKKTGRLKAFFKGALAVVGGIAVIAAVNYIKSGWDLFSSGKDVPLQDLSSSYYDPEGKAGLILDKEAMTSILTLGDFYLSSSFDYVDGCLKISTAGLKGAPEGLMTCIDATSFYWPSQNLYLLAQS
jgi:hypothetical protein